MKERYDCDLDAKRRSGRRRIDQAFSVAIRKSRGNSGDVPQT